MGFKTATSSGCGYLRFVQVWLSGCMTAVEHYIFHCKSVRCHFIPKSSNESQEIVYWDNVLRSNSGRLLVRKNGRLRYTARNVGFLDLPETSWLNKSAKTAEDPVITKWGCLGKVNCSTLSQLPVRDKDISQLEHDDQNSPENGMSIENRLDLDLWEGLTTT
ncbi:hypothetical protein EMCRGX_G018240 [Ephydatia muelleri]